MKLEAIPWFVLFLPLLAAALITLFTRRDRKLGAGISIAAVVIGFVLSIIFIASRGWGHPGWPARAGRPRDRLRLSRARHGAHRAARAG